MNCMKYWKPILVGNLTGLGFALFGVASIQSWDWVTPAISYWAQVVGVILGSTGPVVNALFTVGIFSTKIDASQPVVPLPPVV